MQQDGRHLRLLALAAVALLAACQPPVKPPPPGMLTLDFVPRKLATAELVLSTATMRLGHIFAFADLPPPNPPPPVDVTLDLRSAGMAVTLTMLPPGLYSRVQFAVEDVSADGTWRGTPLHIDLGGGPPLPPGPGMPGAGLVDLRSATGQEVGSRQDGTFTISVDPNLWFANDLLDSATASGGTITCDAQDNTTLSQMLMMRAVGSFAIE